MALLQLAGCQTIMAPIALPSHVVVTAQFKLPYRTGHWPSLQWIKVGEACVHPISPYELPHPIWPPIDGLEQAWAHMHPIYRTHPAVN